MPLTAAEMAKNARLPAGVPPVYRAGFPPPAGDAAAAMSAPPAPKVPIGSNVSRLALPPPPAAPVPTPGVPPTTVVPPSGDTVMVDSAGRASVSGTRPLGNAASQLGTTPQVQVNDAAGRAAARASAYEAAGNPQGARFAGNARALATVPQAAAPAASAAPAAEAAAGRSVAYRMGQAAAPARGAISAASKLGATGVGALLTGGLVGLGTDTQTYADRFGVDAPQTFGGDVALRTAGVASDVVAAIPDFAIGAANLVGRGVKAAFPDAPDYLTAQAPTMSDLYARTEQQTRMKRAAQENGGTLPVGMALAIGPNGEAPRPLLAPSKPTAAQMLAGQPSASGAPATGERPAGDPQKNPGQPQQQEPAAGDEVVGTINGRKITRKESDRLANQNVVPGNAATKLAEPPRDTGPRVFMPQGDDRGTLEKIDAAMSQIGPLDRRSKRDMLVDLLGLRRQTVAGDLDRGSGDARNAADVAQRSAAAQLGADVDREQIASTAANARRQTTQTITDAQGNVYSVDGNTLSPMTKPDGTPLTAATKQDNSLQDAALKLLQESAASGVPMDPATAAAQVAQVAQATRAAQAAPPGTTYAGTQDGVPVYRDAQGRLIQTAQ